MLTALEACHELNSRPEWGDWVSGGERDLEVTSLDLDEGCESLVEAMPDRIM